MEMVLKISDPTVSQMTKINEIMNEERERQDGMMTTLEELVALVLAKEKENNN